MGKSEWREFKRLVDDFELSKEVFVSRDVTHDTSYEEAHRILMEEYDLKYGN